MMTDRPNVGDLIALEEGLACILAPNGSPMTYWGTNTYLLGHDNVAVIDPGPADPAHLAALEAAIAGRSVSHILVTHSHIDHSPLASVLAERTGAPILAYGDSFSGRSDVMIELAETGLVGGGEGVDPDFAPDETVSSGDVISGDGWSVTCLHTPGHFGNHMTFLWGEVGFTGDHMMGWATSLVSPPDGDLTAFMASCDALQETAMTRAYCGHGAPIPDAQARLTELVTHRRSREAEILAALTDGPVTPAALTKRIYTDVAPALLPMAERNVLAHLIDLTTRGIATPQGPLSASATFTREKV